MSAKKVLPPKKIEIGNRSYKLFFKKDLKSEGTKVYGYTSSAHSEIFLDRSMPAKKMAETFIHELLHCIYVDYTFLGMAEEKGEEFYVQVGSVGLTKLFRDNPKALAWYLHLNS